METSELIFEIHPVGLLKCNAYLIGCTKSKRGIIIDPGGEADLLLDRIRHLDLKIEALVHTHTHMDHVGATKQLAEELGAPILIHSDEVQLYRLLKEQRRMFGLPPGEDPRPPDRLLEDEEEIQAGTVSLQVMHTPGHTRGSICIRMGERLFSGDTLFAGSIGRTDLWGISPEKLVQSVKTRLYRLDDDTAVFPGHGEETILGIEKRTNPFLA